VKGRGWRVYSERKWKGIDHMRCRSKGLAFKPKLGKPLKAAMMMEGGKIVLKSY
jgi:hypothetical protein